MNETEKNTGWKEHIYMKKRYLLSTLLLAVMLTACTGKSQETDLQTVTATAGAESKEAQTQTETETEPETAEPEKETLKEDKDLRISVQGNGHTIVFQLNDSAASRSLYNQLPLSLEVEDYSSDEKIFYPPGKLDTGDTPLTEGGKAGGLAYFSSWGNVIMYYGNFGPYSGLYDLGTAVSGSEWIPELSGEILISADGESS